MQPLVTPRYVRWCSLPAAWWAKCVETLPPVAAHATLSQCAPARVTVPACVAFAACHTCTHGSFGNMNHWVFLCSGAQAVMAACPEIARTGSDSNGVSISGSLHKLGGRKNKLLAAKWKVKWVVIARNFLYIFSSARVRSNLVALQLCLRPQRLLAVDRMTNLRRLLDWTAVQLRSEPCICGRPHFLHCADLFGALRRPHRTRITHTRSS